MTERPPTSLELALVQQALEMLLSLEALPEDQIELDTAVQLEEDIAAVVQRLHSEDRRLFVQAAASIADNADRMASGRGQQFREALTALGLDEPE